MDVNWKGRQRHKELYAWERSRREKYRYIAGLDEAGRGPMAGPVVAAAVILPAHPEIRGIDDSKKLSPTRREILFDIILETALAFGIGIRSNKYIDRKGIAPATYSAMEMAVAMLSMQGYCPDIVIVDGFKVTSLTVPQEAVIKADSLSASVASASILAKVTRDRIMRNYGVLYPDYGFASHKGYCTPSHRKQLSFLGPSPIHRLSFHPLSAKLNDASQYLDGGLPGLEKTAARE